MVSFLGEFPCTTPPIISTLVRRLLREEAGEAFWGFAWEVRLDVLEADQRLRLRKPSLRPPALFARPGGGR